MQKKIDRVGMRYGKLVVIAHSHSVYLSSRQGSRQYWRCLCDCGNESVVLAGRLVIGDTTSCGCMSSKSKVGEFTKTHGHASAGRTSTYSTWLSMRARCYSPACTAWKWYGAKGVTICDRWLESFEHFLADMGERPVGKSIDRIDPFGNYEPSNCRWATPLEQGRNKRNSAENARHA